ncbi:thioredoxin family protein [Flavihumibacter sp. CACIAM 22H1]|uniref:thioredoxin family protein n=1 Tax=Flavihumibacter sp. CACIAM 22H1 TaxID=1812911 RepID=UPI0007A88953|nr:thioredoxin family protein [Flavihumibacter sp. CACIAM 22H1]KYP14450.1 MAG: thiol-disulfide isomerase [Flavihumibacter sp. CACIAM 22H1]
MMLSSLLFLLMTHLNGLVWLSDFPSAQAQAKQEHKQILLNFSGSDWCGPCIRLTKELFQSADFEQFASEKLILVRADFPRSKKNQLSKEQQLKNDRLAEQYNNKGSFPLTLLLDENGRIIKSWEGFPPNQAAGLLNELRELTHE